MNIFVLDLNPNIAASFLCDKHISKMAVETTQLLYTAHWSLNESPTGPTGLMPYKATHSNHPCSKWTRDSIDNYKWLVEHGLAIVNEYTSRYKKQHACLNHLVWLKNNIPKSLSSNKKGLTPFAMAFYSKDVALYMSCLVKNDPVLSYRNYYKLDKARFAKWKHSKNPYWW